MNWILIKSLTQIFTYFKRLIIPFILLSLSFVHDLMEGVNSVALSDTGSLGIKEILSQRGCCLTVKTQRCAPD